MKLLGLIINPIAGLGGRVGLKGSDGVEIQRQALALGAQPQSHLRAALALEALIPLRDSFELVTPPGVMGENVARQCGFSPHLLPISLGERGATTADDTLRAGQRMLDRPVDLLLFAGGDGTARDIFSAVGTKLPVLGIPAGVKIHSAVFATHPRAAGEIAAAYIRGERLQLREAEVVDLDEETYRAGTVVTQLYGYLRVPNLAQRLQNKKAPTPAAESVRTEAIAAAVTESMQPGWFYILGPGTTTRAIAKRLGFPKTLVGVDVYTREGVVALDVSEARLLELIENQPAKIIVTPIGGQGCIFGRGNQPISPDVIRKVGRVHVRVVSTREKLQALNGAPLWADTGDGEVDEVLSGYFAVIVGYKESVMYKVSA